MDKLLEVGVGQAEITNVKQHDLMPKASDQYTGEVKAVSNVVAAA